MKGGYTHGYRRSIKSIRSIKRGRGKKLSSSERKKGAKTRRASKIVKKLQSIITRTRRRQSRRT